jgi:hypothetical protein
MDNMDEPQFLAVIDIPLEQIQLQTQNPKEDKAQIEVRYTHPNIKLTLFISVLGEHFYYAYEGSLVFLLKYNNLGFYVNAEYFIQELKNINSLVLDEDTAIFSFPLQLNFNTNTIKVVCTKTNCCSGPISPFQPTELLSKKILELHNLCFNSNVEINKLKNDLSCSKVETELALKLLETTSSNKVVNSSVDDGNCSSYETTTVNVLLAFDVPVSFGDHVSSLVVKFDRDSYRSEIKLPKNLLNLKIEKENIYSKLHIFKLPTIKFPNTLVRLILVNLFGFNQHIDFKSMKNIKEIHLELLDDFNQSVDVPYTVETLIMKGLPSLNQILVIPNSKAISFVDFENNSFRLKVNKKISGVYRKYIINNQNLLIECHSQKNSIIKDVVHWNVGGFKSIPLNKKEWVIKMYLNNKNKCFGITFF